MKKGVDYLLMDIDEYIGYVNEDAMKKYKVKITKVKDNWIFGTIKGLKFQAQVFKDPSKFGLYNGRISKLIIIRKGCPHWGDTIYHYERGLGDKPTKEGINLSRQFLKVFPKSKG